jgi:nucleotide-binding universal stress UspA family protein
MFYKTVLVHLHDARRAKSVLGAAVPLARNHGSHLIGLAVVPPVIVIPSVDAGASAVVIEEHRTAYRAEMAALKAMFEEATRDQTFAAEWREVDAAYDDATRIVTEHGRCCDLVIASQKDAEWPYSEQLEAPDQLVIECGRPVLLVPKTYEPSEIGRRVVVAWNGRREATRAVFDALPLLQAAQDVIVVWVNPQQEGEKAGDLPGFDICAALARHGVRCEATQNIRPSVDIGNTLLDTVKAQAADLLVMGCYGHWRVREFVFGGASRHVLEHMVVPVLMSH